MTSIDGVHSEGRDTQGELSGGASAPTDAATIGIRIARTWKAGSGCIAAGLVGSFLTCLASVGAHVLVDRGGAGFPAALCLRKLATGHAAAASLVIAVFPLLPPRTRRRRCPDFVETPR